MNVLAKSMIRIAAIILVLSFLSIPCSAARNGIETTELKVIARQILAEVRFLDAMKDSFAIDKNLPKGTQVTPAQLLEVVTAARSGKRPKPIRLMIALKAEGGPRDLLGNPYSAIMVGEVPKIHRDTLEALQAVAPREFWGPYAPGE